MAGMHEGLKSSQPEANAFSGAAELTGQLEAEVEQTPETLESGIFKLAEEWPVFPDRNLSKQPEVKQQVHQLIEKYQANYPDELEGIAALTDVASRATHGRQKGQFPATEYQYLLASHALNNVDKPRYMGQLWTAIQQIAEKSQRHMEFKSGVLGVVATHRSLQRLGYDPRLSSPKDDADSAIDLWVATDHAAQIKRQGGHSLGFSRTAEITHPAVEITEAGSSRVFSVEQERFVQKVDEYAAQVGHPVEGYFVAVPATEMDPVTGEPSEKLVEEFRQALKSTNLETPAR